MAPSIFRFPLVQMVLSSELQLLENACHFRITFFCVRNMVEAASFYTMLTSSPLFFFP